MMPLLIREVADIMRIVEWELEMEDGGGTSVETLLLDRFPECRPFLTLTCTYGEVVSKSAGSCGSRTIYLSLVQPEKPVVRDSEAICSDRGTADVIPTWCCKPTSISVSFGGTKEYNMKREDTLNEAKWLYETTNYPNSYRSEVAGLVRFSIKFGTFGVSEMFEALKHVTDYFFLQQSHCDVQFCFPNDEHPIGAHVKILSSRSSVFAAMFQHEMQESKTGKVSIQDTGRDIFYQLLHYIYSGRILTSLTEDTAQKLLLAADKYNVTQLAKECTSYLIANIQWDKAVDLMIWAHLYSIDKIKEEALKVVVKNGKKVCPLDSWKELAINYPHLCLEATRRMMA
ncbi:BTB and MATH domain-containing protein 38-like [Daphnia magna]|uniref:BTB and MATH domain-containing protein 38-like n=1 Tax=Daphnia magna TaxID=35525 RepID=UPI001E1BAB11|nr:BTB and MATH domain-containing protein 38-like [Daphnia magna]